MHSTCVNIISDDTATTFAFITEMLTTAWCPFRAMFALSICDIRLGLIIGPFVKLLLHARRKIIHNTTSFIFKSKAFIAD